MTWSDMLVNCLVTAGKAIWFFLPAYFANATPVVLGGGTPIDLGKNFLDGRRILGDGKTFRGFFLALAAGTLIGALQQRPFIGFIMSLGAMLGDMAVSFLKRRLGLKRGDPLPVGDQLDFVAGAVALTAPVVSIPLSYVIAIVVVTPPIHLGTNALAYLLKLKDRPW